MKFLSPFTKSLFRSQGWDIVRQIPSGKIAIYGQIAQLITPSTEIGLRNYIAFSARRVGSAMGACPGVIPWHRVINAQGKISLHEGAELQRHLLEAEGIIFDYNQRIDLARFG